LPWAEELARLSARGGPAKLAALKAEELARLSARGGPAKLAALKTDFLSAQVDFLHSA
jgi:hypothetical protein